MVLDSKHYAVIFNAGFSPLSHACACKTFTLNNILSYMWGKHQSV